MRDTLPPAPDLEPFLTRVALPPGWQVVYEPVVTSTNDIAREAVARGWPERAVFVCDYQSAGRGRQGRAWTAPPGSGLLASMLFHQRRLPPLYYTMLCSVSAAEAVEHLLGIQVAIKWPNDLMVEDRKVAGVLAEAAGAPEDGYVIVGLGINANLTRADLAQLPGRAGSLSEAAGRPVHRGELLVLLLERLQAWLSAARGDPGPLWQAWHARLWGRQQQVRVREQDETLDGVVEGAQADGTLLLRCADGSLRRIVTGEIIL